MLQHLRFVSLLSRTHERPVYNVRHLFAIAVAVSVLSAAISVQATASMEDVEARHKAILEYKDKYDIAISALKEMQETIDSARRILEKEEEKLTRKEADYERIRENAENRKEGMADKYNSRIDALEKRISRYEDNALDLQVDIEISEDETTIAELEEKRTVIERRIRAMKDKIKQIESKQREEADELENASEAELNEIDESIQKHQEGVLRYRHVLASHMTACMELEEIVDLARESVVGMPDHLSRLQRWTWTPHLSWLKEAVRIQANIHLLDEMEAAIRSMGITFPDGDQEQIPISCR